MNERDVCVCVWAREGSEAERGLEKMGVCMCWEREEGGGETLPG